MNKENKIYIHYGSVLTKEQTDTIYEFAKIPVEDLLKLEYTDKEEELLKLLKYTHKNKLLRGSI